MSKIEMSIIFDYKYVSFSLNNFRAFQMGTMLSGALKYTTAAFQVKSPMQKLNSHENKSNDLGLVHGKRLWICCYRHYKLSNVQKTTEHIWDNTLKFDWWRLTSIHTTLATFSTVNFLVPLPDYHPFGGGILRTPTYTIHLDFNFHKPNLPATTLHKLQ